MSWQWWCACLGLIFVAIGAALALIGFRKTWSDFVSDEKFSRALTGGLLAGWTRTRKALIAAYNLVVRRKRYIEASDRVTSVDAAVGIGFNALPLEFPESKELPDIVRDLWERSSKTELQLRKYVQQNAQSLGAAQEDLSQRVTVVDEKVVKVAVGGLSLQAWGLILVTVGTILSSVPALAQVSSPSKATRVPYLLVSHASAQAAGSIWATDVPGWITGVGTAILAVFAIFAAYYAREAFRKQSQEVRAIEQQVLDQQEITRQQAKLLKIQSDQVELQRQQLDDQRKANVAQAGVLELQAAELRESLEERKYEAEQRRKAQASQVYIQQALNKEGIKLVTPFIAVTVVNASDEPVYDASLRWYRGSASHGDPNPEQLDTLGPGDRFERSREFPKGTNMAVSGAVLTFRDAAGVTWMRRPDGTLTEQHLQRATPHISPLSW